MGFQISPGVQFTEIDLTGIIPAVSTTDGGYAGPFRWGPVEEVVLISNENELVETYGKPDEHHEIVSSFFTCANFLAYGDKLRVVRSADTLSSIERTLTITALDKTNGKITFKESLAATGSLPGVKRLDRIALTFIPDQEDLVIFEKETDKVVEVHYATPIPQTLVDALAAEEDDEITVVVKCYNGATNATSDTLGALIKNDDDYTLNYASGQGDCGPWAARFPGELGNSIAVSICTSATAHQTVLPGKHSTRQLTNDNNEWILGDTDSKFTEYLIKGSVVINTKNLEERTVTEITDNRNIKIDRPFTTPLSEVTLAARWAYASLFNEPTTSSYAARRNAKNDEINIVVIDQNGAFTGTPGTVLEKYGELSVASDARLEDNTAIYYKDVVNQKSNYIRWTDHPVFTGSTIGANDAKWGEPVVPSKNFTVHKKPLQVELAGGKDALDTINGEQSRKAGYDQFKDPDKVDVSLLIMGNAGASVTNYVIDNIALKRLDCVVFCSPPLSTVKGNPRREARDIVNYRRNALNANTSYAVMDSGWKVQFNKYNNKKVDVPLNADIAGLCVRTETTRDAWWSPAGYDRGQIKNVEKLYFSPDRTDRDELYKNSVNPVIDQPGEGRLLFGDKTLLTKASAFDRINVRRLFIVLEKAISRASKALLFEFNDEFTRQIFRSMVEPFLRDVQSKRGIYDFRVVCDRTNNTPEIIDRNEFVGDIYIKPARSINFIQLNFIAVRTGVEFSEIVGKF